MSQLQKRIIISGGGTGGHVFPAIAIANALKAVDPGADILFVGARGRMEMEKVPAAGYRIYGLPVAGFQRRQLWKNPEVLVKLLRSLYMSSRIIREFKPQVVVGVGGYASGPVLQRASMRGIPTLIQEQNSYAGLTNRLLAKKAEKICVAYEGMERYFPKDKIILTGNPVRQDLEKMESRKAEGWEYFGLKPYIPVILVLGGSLGARTINESIKKGLDRMLEENVQILWQTGSIYYEHICKTIEGKNTERLVIRDFISRMDLAYSVADIVISRAGAATISELCIVGLPSVLVPSPNVAEDHQAKNALALVEKHAALIVSDKEASESLVTQCLLLVKDEEMKKLLHQNISQMAQRNAAERIAKEVLALIKEEN
jgi:UDP-N-acetylglucosamine--N-acetylmuramyl-(pentapeptide) pyrophosphoryl-undecaprenol N-acetylglucosamine transferase